VFTVTAVMVLASAAHALEASVSGQVNQMVMWADNGEDSKVFVADNDNSSTRVRFEGAEEMDWGKFGFTMEIEAQRNASNRLDIPAEGEAWDDGSFEWNDRKLEAYFDANWGKISLGKGDGAANGTSEVDLSGTTVAGYSEITATAGGFSFIDSNTKEKVTTVGKTRNNFDGLSRNERIRYDTPTWGGFSLAASYTNGQAYEFAGFWAGVFADHEIVVEAGYVDSQEREQIEPEDENFSQFGASASWLAPFGLNLTAAYGSRDFELEGKEDATNWYVKLGWIIGIHALAIDYGVTEELQEKDDEGTNYGLFYVMKPWKGIEFYGAGRVYQLDRTGVDLEDITQIYAGTRIKF
jgi:predicted porin